jgi:hypothetical protein
MRPNADPSIHAGNRRRRLAKPVVAAALSLAALAGCSTDQPAPISQPSTEAPSVNAPSPNEQLAHETNPEAQRLNLEARIQAQTSELAGRAIVLSDRKDSRIVVASSTSLEAGADPSEPQKATLSIRAHTQAMTGDSEKGGTYDIMIQGLLSPETNRIDPSTVSSFAIVMNIGEDNLFTYGAAKEADGWAIVHKEQSKGSVVEDERYVTWPAREVPRAQPEAPFVLDVALTADQFEELNTQAQVAMQLAEAFAPINIAPGN